VILGAVDGPSKLHPATHGALAPDWKSRGPADLRA
jgi:hypothetical protein